MKDNSNAEQITYIKIIEYSFLVLGMLLFISGLIVIAIGSNSFSNYYIPPIDMDNFITTFKEFLVITTKYSTLFYMGIFVLMLGVICYLISIATFVKEFELYKEKAKILDDVLKTINPEGRYVKTVKVGQKYVAPNKKDKHKKE